MISTLRLRHWLFISFTLIAVIPVIFLAAWVEKPMLQREISDANEKHLLIARCLASTLVRYIADVEAIFRFAVAAHSADHLTPALSRLLAAVELRQVYITDSKGQVLDHYGPATVTPPSRLPQSLLDQITPRLAANQTDTEVIFSSVLPGFNQRPRVYVAMELPGQRLAVGALSTAYLVELQRTVSFGVQGHATIVDQTGKVLAHPQADWSLGMKDLSSLPPVNQMLAGQSGVTTFFSPATQKTMVAGYTSISKLGWGAMIPQPLSELERSAADLFARTLQLVLLGLLGAAILSWWLAGYLARPVLAIMSASRQVMTSQPIAPITLGQWVPVELNSLIASFNKMVREIAVTSQALEKKSAILETTLEHMAEGIAVVDRRRSELVLCNRRFAELFQLPANLVHATPLALAKTANPAGDAPPNPTLDCHTRKTLVTLLDAPAGSTHHVQAHGRIIEQRSNPLSDRGHVLSYIDVTERERLENTLRTLHLISTRQALTFLDKIAALLESGCRQFNLPFGILSHIAGEQYRIVHAITPDGSITPGTEMALGITYCRETLQADAPLGFERATASEWRTHPCFQAFKLEAYLGMPVRVGNSVYGTLNFSSLTPRSLRFTSTDKELLKLMAQWVGSEISKQQAEQALFAAKERAQVTLQSIGDGVITTGADSCIDYLNPTAERLTGWPLREAQGKPLKKVFPIAAVEKTKSGPTESADAGLGHESSQSQTLIRRDKTRHSIEASYAPIRAKTGELVGQVVVFRDVTEARQLARQIAHQATHDALTGLVNRGEFEHRLQRVLETSREQGVEHALCYLDMDQFKVINDTCGHIAGDALLRQLGNLIPAQTRKRDTVARLGGDEFGILMEHCSLSQARRVANAILRALEDFRFVWEGTSFSVGASIGLVPVGADDTSITAVLSAADNACYTAKEQGRHRVHIYRENDADLTKRRGEMQWAARLPRALEADRFQLYYQSIVPLSDTPGEHFEFLLRMHDETGQLVVPGAFLPAAERYGFSTKLDRWVIRAALSWLQRHQRQLDRLALCTINLSGHSLGDEDFLQELMILIRQTPIPPQKICFEITETVAIANLGNATRFIKALKAMGCRFALDDFGSGLSSFAYLKNLPVDFLKIDGLFVKDINKDPLDLALVKSINDIGHVMGKKTIAEFVENKALLKKLREIGVDYAQGYGIGRPQPIADML